MGFKEEFIVHPEVRKKLEKLIEEKEIINYVLNIESGAMKGDNYLGVIAKATVEGVHAKDGQNVTLRWIIKSAPQVDTFRKFINVARPYSREIYMYEKVLPLFREFEIEKNVLNPFTSTPPFYMGCLEEFQECLVMEDMKALGYQLKDRKLPLDFNHVRLVMRLYGKFHALSYALKDQKPDLMRKLALESKENFFSFVNAEQMRHHTSGICEKAMHSLDPVKDKKCLDSFEKYRERCFDVLLESFDLSSTDSDSTIVHGDSWVNNMLFRYNDPQRSDYPTDVCLLDFQLAKYGSPAFDLSYFIFTCTDKTLRDEYYDQILRIYYAALCSHLVDLGSDPQKVFPFHALEAQMKKYSVYGLYMTIMVLYLMMSETDEIPDLSQSMTEEELTNSFLYESKNTDIYNDRVRGVIIDFVEKGYLDLHE